MYGTLVLRISTKYYWGIFLVQKLRCIHPRWIDMNMSTAP